MATECGTGWNSEAAQGILYKELPGTAGTHPILMTSSLTLAGVTSSPTPEGGGPEHWAQEFTEPEPVGAHTEGPRRGTIMPRTEVSNVLDVQNMGSQRHWGT